MSELNMETDSKKHDTPTDANNVLAAGLSKHQLMIYGLCKNYGAEIQVDINFDKGCTEYTLVEDGGDTETIRKDTFEKLKKVGAIQLKWKSAVFVERCPALASNVGAAWRRLPNENLNIRTKLSGSFCQTAVMCWAVYQH